MTTPSRYPTQAEIDERLKSRANEQNYKQGESFTEAVIRHAIDIERERAAKEAGECSVAGLADDLRLVAQLESKRMGAMSSGLLKCVIGRLSALPPPPEEGTVA